MTESLALERREVGAGQRLNVAASQAMWALTDVEHQLSRAETARLVRAIETLSRFAAKCQ
jgi:hypothetical protein